MLTLSRRTAAWLHKTLNARAPSNRLVRLLRTSRDRRNAVGIGAIAAVAYWLTALTSSVLAEGGSGAFHLVAIVSVWNAMKVAWAVALPPPRCERGARAN